ncbi:helix-turn-helix domain-containing protein [Runella limosa]|uniref:helix-turn-helix domain-containing protein n=1 Tax=Runella limosa TaxID=370978 RepID=UPI0005670655|nr:helix-turn-helix transcriptional regulator [Runella limosa]
MSISKRISDLRLRQGLKQSDIAAALGWSQSSYSRIETKPQNMTIEELEKIAGVLGVSAVELLTGEGQKVDDSEEVARLRAKIEELESDKAYLQSLIDFLKEDKEFNQNFLKDIVKKLGSYIADVKASNYTELLNGPEFKDLEFTVNFMTEMFKFIKEKPE